MDSLSPRRWLPLLCILLLVIVICGWYFSPLAMDRESGQPDRAKRIVSARDSDEIAPSRGRPRRYLSLGAWQRAAESILGGNEAKRSRILEQKSTVDSEVYLLGVEPPTPGEIEAITKELDELRANVSPGDREKFTTVLAAMIRDYDPYGEEGRRVIQIDIPDEPNGRLTGFTCRVGSFEEMTERFLNGEMADLQDVRGYAADYAGMPLTRFQALISTKE